MADPAHRQYPPPRSPWAMRMGWDDLLFMHWPVPAAALRAAVPPGLEVDTYTGGPWHDQAFIGVVPFRMRGTRARFTPAIPGGSDFCELNVRTYVWPKAEGRQRPGVYFFSLDAESPAAVWGARLGFRLNYYHAQMRCDVTEGGDPDGGWIEYRSRRTHRGAAPAELDCRYRPAGEVFRAAPGSVESFVTDRYCLYTGDDRGRVRRCEIDHDPWPLQIAEAQVRRCTMTEPIGLALNAPAPMLHFARRMDVVAWMPGNVRGASARPPGP